MAVQLDEAHAVFLGPGEGEVLSGTKRRIYVRYEGPEYEVMEFECEPGTLTEHKLKVIRDHGVTRLSLGVEHFDDHVLEINGRAHHSKEIGRAYEWAQAAAVLRASKIAGQ